MTLLSRRPIGIDLISEPSEKRLESLIDEVQLSSLSNIVESIDISPKPQDDIFKERKFAKWHGANNIEARCDFSPNRHGLFLKGDFYFHAVWRKSLYGRTLSDIKSDERMIPYFAAAVADMIRKSIGRALDQEQWAIITAPKRRHKIKNFASAVAEGIAAEIGVPFFDDVCFCDNRKRVGAVFRQAENLPGQKNLIVFDDIVTTGSTLESMHALFAPLGYNLVYFTAICNK